MIFRRNREYTRFPLSGVEVTIAVREPGRILILEQFVEALFTFSLEQILSDMNQDNSVGFSIDSSNNTLERMRLYCMERTTTYDT